MFASLIKRLNVQRIKLFQSSMIISTLALMVGCQGSEMNASKDPQIVEWQKLSETVIFFGHQSVGNNILDGIKDIATENLKVNLLITDDAEAKNNAGLLFIHSKIGENGELKQKVDDFKGIMDGGVGAIADVAFMKFCYVDFNKSTDVGQIFRYYTDTMKYLRDKYPKTKFVHVTVPVEVNLGTWKTWIKTVIGKEDIWEYESAIPRGQYNALLRKEFEGKEPLFDLATVESTHANGKKEVFEHKGTKYPALVPEYTTDGGHLNEKGRKVVAEQLLIFLANLSG